jgi:hypothetical protein
MNVYCYFVPVKGINEANEKALIDLWRENWLSQGFNPIVLNEDTAKLSPIHKEYGAIVDRFPTVNAKGYDYAVWMRLLALSQVKDDLALFTDYDLFNYGWQMNGAQRGKINLYSWNVTCCIVVDPRIMESVCREIMQITPDPRHRHNGTPNFEDMHWLGDVMHQRTDIFNVLPSEVVEYGDPGWETSKLVHYCNKMMMPKKLIPRHPHIKNLRSW